MGRGAGPVGGSGGGAAGAPPQNQMIDRYTRPEMGRIWSQEARYESWLQVELAVCEVYARRGLIPADALGRIKAGARISAARIAEIEATTRHDVVAFLTQLEEALGADSRYVHMGLDVLGRGRHGPGPPAPAGIGPAPGRPGALPGRRSGRLPSRTATTLCVGRTHGVHAEPMVFGLKPALWYAEAGRNLERLRRAREAVRVGKISGAVGTFAHVDPDVEEEVCRLLGLEAAPVSTQIVQRDRHAEFCAALGIAAASLEKVALEIRSLQRTEVLEAEEPFEPGQKGSSAMPHKRNPVSCEQVCGLARLVRGNVVAALEDVALWHERDISHSSVERVILPDGTALLDYMLDQMTRIVGGLQVYPERMRENMDRSFGLMFSQRVLLRLADKGLPRQRAYDLVQRNAMRAWRERRRLPRSPRGRPGGGRAPARSRARRLFRSLLVPAERGRHLSPGPASSRTERRRRRCRALSRGPGGSLPGGRHMKRTATKYEQREKLYEGKAKIVYATQDPGVVIQYFKDDATAFNAQKRGTIVGKGVVNNRMSAAMFERLGRARVPTHYLGMPSEREMLCRRLDIIKIETIVRNVVAGSLAKRTGLDEGTGIRQPIVELYYKSDPLGDPMINDDHVRMLALATAGRAPVDPPHRPPGQRRPPAVPPAQAAAPGGLQARVWSPPGPALARRRDQPRHLPPVGRRHSRSTRQGPLPARHGGRRGGLPGGVPPRGGGGLGKGRVGGAA